MIIKLKIKIKYFYDIYIYMCIYIYYIEFGKIVASANYTNNMLLIIYYLFIGTYE